MAPTAELAPAASIDALAVTLPISEEQIAAFRAQYAALTADTPEGYEAVRLAIANCRDTRGAVERRRVELKADALAWGRKVDTEAKRITALLEAIEEPLKAKKSVVDTEKARIKAEADAAKLRALQAEIDAKNEAREREQRAAREAEEARLADERARLAAEREALDAERRRVEEAARVAREAEEARIASERAKLAEERRLADEATRKEREALDAERRRVEAERAAAERVEFERQAAIKAEQDARERVEREQIEAATRKAKLDALRPDIEKALAFAQAIRNLTAPTLKSKHAKAVISRASDGLLALATALETDIRAVS